MNPTSVLKMPIELSEMSLEHVFCSYSSIKGHRMRCEKEIENLLGLLEHQYSSTSEESLNDRLEKLERHTLRLLDIKDYLLHLKYARAINHEEEVQEFLEVLDKCSKDTFAILHDRHAAAQAIAAPAQAAAAAARTAPKPSTTELKPEKLTYDSSMANYHSWVNNFGRTLMQVGLTHCLARNSRHTSITALMRYFVQG